MVEEGNDANVAELEKDFERDEQKPKLVVEGHERSISHSAAGAASAEPDRGGNSKWASQRK